MGSKQSTNNQKIEDEISTVTSNNKVVIYSKSYCPYCRKVKDLFRKEFPDITVKVIELDVVKGGSSIQSTLKTMTAQRTVPSVWINGKHIGGNDDTQSCFASGKLKEMLK